MSRYFPVSIDMKDKLVLVIGAGTIAYRKIEKLSEYDCNIKIVSRKLKDRRIEKYIENSRVEFIEKEVEDSDFEAVDIIITATDDLKFNREIYEKYQEKAFLINSVDDVDNSNFIFGANLKRGDLNILVSSSGSSPFLAVKIRDFIDRLIGSEYAKVMDNLKDFRMKIKRSNIENKEKRSLLKKAVDYINIGEKVDLDILKKRLENLLPKK